MASTSKKKAATKPKEDPVYPRLLFRCGAITKASVIKAAEKERRKEGALCRFIIEQWLQLQGYEVDQA